MSPTVAGDRCPCASHHHPWETSGGAGRCLRFNPRSRRGGAGLPL